jgi:excisionase family DNA binding protein
MAKVRTEGLSVQDVATLLDVHECTVWRWIHSDHIEAVRSGPRLWRIPASEIGRLRAMHSSKHKLAQPSTSSY